MRNLMKRLVTGVVVIGALALASATLTPAAATGVGNEGCTPGYWKNHPASWQVYAPTTTLNTMLSVNWVNGVKQVTPNPVPASLGLGGDSMMKALGYPGGTGLQGGARILLRAAVAAYLNDAHNGVLYPIPRFLGTQPAGSPYLQKLVLNALKSGDRSKMIAVASQLDGHNNLGCPIGRAA